MKGSVVSPARVLLITHENPPGNAAGRIDAYRQLIDTGELAAFDAVNYRTLETSTDYQTFLTVLDQVRSRQYDVAVIGTPGIFPRTHDQFNQVNEALRGRLFLYWEGDPWGKEEPITRQMTWWFRRADIVFSTGGDSQAQLYMAAGAQRVFHIANTYCP